MHDVSLPWISLLALGAAHGVNPAMGWLFAVGRGLQERDRRALWRALGPLALGHVLAIGVALWLTLALGRVLPLGWLRWIVAAVLLAVGIDGLVRRRHEERPRGELPRAHAHAAQPDVAVAHEPVDAHREQGRGRRPRCITFIITLSRPSPADMPRRCSPRGSAAWM